MFDKLLHKKKKPATAPNHIALPKTNTPTRTSYTSYAIPIPPSFLSPTDLPEDSNPVTTTTIDFSKTCLPEYAGLHAVVLDNVLSPSECHTLIKLAEASVEPEVAAALRQITVNNGAGSSNNPRPDDEDEDNDEEGEGGGEGSGNPKKPAQNPWTPALVNIGPGWEVLQPDYRNSDRIIWDQEGITSRLWQRIASVSPVVAQALERVELDNEAVLGAPHGFRSKGDWEDLQKEGGWRWKFMALNSRMRFLRYGGGQFFKPHCDGSYHIPNLPHPRKIRTLFTLHLYLNDSVAALNPSDPFSPPTAAGTPEPDLVGGSTPFLSNDEQRRMDVNPRAGRVLIFQHRRLLHSGDDVVKGTKYTMRSDLLYELMRDEIGAEGEGEGETSK